MLARKPFIAAALLSLPVLALVLGPRPVAGDDAERVHARKLFEKRCQSCHLVPDPTYETDRAWIDQILETA